MADNKGTPAPPAASPTVADLMEVIKKLGESMGDSIKQGIALGIGAAAAAREASDLNFANARQARQNLGAACHKCRMPVKVCGGPEMKTVPVLDAEGKPVLKDGKPVTQQVEATKPGDEDANHVKMVVLPSDPDAARWFQFIGINGVKFASRRHGQRILVPRKNDFQSILNTFQNFERDFKQSRKVRFNRGAQWAPKPLQFTGRNSPLGGGSGPRYVS